MVTKMAGTTGCSSEEFEALKSKLWDFMETEIYPNEVCELVQYCYLMSRQRIAGTALKRCYVSGRVRSTVPRGRTGGERVDAHRDLDGADG